MRTPPLTFPKTGTDTDDRGCDIIVFPEKGLMLGLDDRQKLSLHAEDIPDAGALPCLEGGDLTPVLAALSCLARDNRIYVVANVYDHKHCPPGRTSCPPDGVLFYNTNVALDRNGTLVSRWENLSLNLCTLFVCHVKAEGHCHESEILGVLTGTIFFRPTSGHGISVLLTAQYTSQFIPRHDVLPGIYSVAVQQAWSLAHGVPLLAAGVQRPPTGTLGSGIYAGGRGPLIYSYSPDNRSKLLIANTDAAAPENSRYAGDVLDVRSLTFSYMNTSAFAVASLLNASGEMLVCNGEVCCRLSYASTELSDAFFLIAGWTKTSRTARPSEVLSPGRLPFAEDAEARRSRRTRAAPTVAASLLDLNTSGLDSLREIVREVVRKELRKILPAANRPSSLSLAEVVREEVHRAFQPEGPINTTTPEEPTLSYAAMARRPPQAHRQTTAPPRRDPPMPQYPRRQEGQVQDVRAEQPSPRKTDVWRTADRRPLCYHCGEADHIYRSCPYRRLGLRGFHPNDPRPSGVGNSTRERPRVDDSGWLRSMGGDRNCAGLLCTRVQRNGRVCSLTVCDKRSEGRPCTKMATRSSTRFSSLRLEARFATPYVYPVLASDGLALTSVRSWNFETSPGHSSSLSIDERNPPKEPILHAFIAAIDEGREISKEDPSETKTGREHNGCGRSSQEVEKGLGRGEREGLAWHCQTTRKCGTVAAVRALRRIAMGYTVEKGRR
ncbi:hypothetical protein HPB47_019988, partial [Ixodes persulcatus]